MFRLSKKSKPKQILFAMLIITISVSFILFYDTAVNATIVTTEVTVSADDGRGWLITNWVDNEATLYFGVFSGVEIHPGFRFRNVLVPRGVVITSANITVSTGGLSGSHAGGVWYGNDVDSAGIWTAGDYPQLMTRTTASTSWVPVAGDANTTVEIDITDIVQEIVDREGWDSGNNMKFGLVTNDGSGSTNLPLTSLDGGYATTLNINYASGGEIVMKGGGEIIIKGGGEIILK